MGTVAAAQETAARSPRHYGVVVVVDDVNVVPEDAEELQTESCDSVDSAAEARVCADGLTDETASLTDEVVGTFLTAEEKLDQAPSSSLVGAI